jgi:DNA-binding MarR family transcriptional regulator
MEMAGKLGTAKAGKTSKGVRRVAAQTFAGHARTPREAANAEAHIALLKVASHMANEFSAVMKPVDLSLSQYNVLRILRGAGPEGATCGEVIERMIQRDPDVTRLLDRLERRGLIERSRDTRDRRIVRTCITETGLSLLASLDRPVDDLHHRHLGRLSDRRLAELRELTEVLKP